MVRLCVLLAVVAVVAAACRGAADPVAVRPIEDVLAGEIDVTPDVSGRSAVLRVTTTEDVACAVVYGEDDDFGSVAVDGDMQGGAHRDHMPLLTGLEPETTYRYVLQGTDTHGRLYRSGVMTFTTPAATEEDLPGRNAALDATVTGASSAFSDAFAPELAIDGDPSTEWATDGDADAAWIEIDLGATLDLVAVRLRSRSMTDGTSVIETYTVTVDDGDPLGPFDAGSDAPIEALDASGRHVRLDAVRTTGGNTGATEVEVYTAS